jgi:hypothetical protein
LHPLWLSLAEVLMLTEHTVTTITVACDGPGCTTPSITTPTEAGLLTILRNMGWRVPDVDADGKIDRDQPVYCKACTAALQAAGKLGA